MREIKVGSVVRVAGLDGEFEVVSIKLTDAGYYYIVVGEDGIERVVYESMIEEVEG